MKPFNLQEAISGKPIVTRDGKCVRFLTTISNPTQPVVCVVQSDKRELVERFNENGTYMFDHKQSNLDLFMAPIKKEGWVMLYNPDGAHKLVAHTSSVYPTKEDCDKLTSSRDRIACVHIEWEE